MSDLATFQLCGEVITIERGQKESHPVKVTIKSTEEWGDEIKEARTVVSYFKTLKDKIDSRLSIGMRVETSGRIAGHSWTPQDGGETKWFTDFIGSQLHIITPQAIHTRGNESDTLPF